MGFDDGAAKGTGASVWQAWTRPASARRAAGAAPCALMLLATDCESSCCQLLTSTHASCISARSLVSVSLVQAT